MAIGEVQSEGTNTKSRVICCEVCGEILGKKGSSPAIKVGGNYRHKLCARPINRMTYIYPINPKKQEN